jgi:YHS domain-containing protein
MKTRIPLLVFSLLMLSACASVKTPVFSTDDGALRGYDPVAYFVDGEPRKGRPELSHEYNETRWFFANESNLQKFKVNPASYTPQYGGYCAYAMSKNLVVSTDPNAWHIENDKLYLNYSMSVRNTWLKDIPGYIEKANDNWLDKTTAEASE